MTGFDLYLHPQYTHIPNLAYIALDTPGGITLRKLPPRPPRLHWIWSREVKKKTNDLNATSILQHGKYLVFFLFFYRPRLGNYVELPL